MEMNILYYEKTLIEAKELLKDLDGHILKIYRTCQLIANWVIGLNVFMMYQIWMHEASARVMLFITLVPTCVCLYYAYKIMMGDGTHTLNGIEPNNTEALKDTDSISIYNSYIGVYQRQISTKLLLQDKGFSLLRRLKKGFVVMLVLFVLTFFCLYLL